MNTWFTSDLHYGHKNIAGPSVSSWSKGYRNFNSVQEMNNAIIKNINDCVKPEDTMYFLGDWAFGGFENIYRLRKSLVCENIHLILGNHDENIIDKEFKFREGGVEVTFNPYELFTSIDSAYTGYIGKNLFHLSHYSHRVWPKSHRGSFHLYGHSHGSIPNFGKSMDVGIDCHPEFRPFHIDEIIKLLKDKETPSLDHHR